MTGIADDAPPMPWWILQKLRLSDFLRGQGINVTCIHRPAYYYAMHRVDYATTETQYRGDSSLSKTMIRENNLPGITDPDFLVNWIDVRDVGKWVGTVLRVPGGVLEPGLLDRLVGAHGPRAGGDRGEEQPARHPVPVPAVPAAG